MSGRRVLRRSRSSCWWPASMASARLRPSVAGTFLRPIGESVLLVRPIRSVRRPEQLGRWAERWAFRGLRTRPALIHRPWHLMASKAGVAAASDVVIIDTAGRLPSSRRTLIEELRKIVACGLQGGRSAGRQLLRSSHRPGRTRLPGPCSRRPCQLTGVVLTKLDAYGRKVGGAGRFDRSCGDPIEYVGGW